MVLASSVAGIAGWALIAGTLVQLVLVEGVLAALVLGMAAVASVTMS